MRKCKKLCFMLFIILCSAFFCTGTMAAKKNFTVTPKSKPYKKKNVNAKPYNKYTKTYIMLRTYLDQLGKKGGGTLTLKKGTYNITNALLVPSNVTIVLNNGVVLKKTDNTHTKYLKAGHVLFEFVRASRIHSKGVVGKYNGEKNIKIVGKGNATIDVGNSDNSEGMRIPHCKNVTIKGVTFRNLKDSHFIEVVASKNVNITGCTFKNCLMGVRSAINVEWADSTTGGFTGVYSKYDGTSVNGLTIQNCKFIDLDLAIDTHTYSSNPHQNIHITDCIFQRVLLSIKYNNWLAPIIRNNTYVECMMNNENTDEEDDW